jgi:hypothetical protein
MTLVTLAARTPTPIRPITIAAGSSSRQAPFRQSCAVVHKFGADQLTLAFLSLGPKEIGVRLFRAPRIATNLLGG